MTTEQKQLDALKAIAAIPLWGEPITNPDTATKRNWRNLVNTIWKKTLTTRAVTRNQAG